VESYLVVDSSKFGKVRAAHFAEVSAFASIITDRS
jgi:DeoR/GlpR family transcriptional regulator of sugar metabolism